MKQMRRCRYRRKSRKDPSTADIFTYINLPYTLNVVTLPTKTANSEDMRNKFDIRFGYRLIIPVAALVVLIGLLSGPFAERLVSSWGKKDLQLRARLIANSLDERVVEELPQQGSVRAQRQFERLVRDDRLYAVGFCSKNGGLTNASAEFFKDFECAPTTEETDDVVSLPSGKRYLVSRIPLPVEDPDSALGRLIVVHDMDYVSSRASEAGRFLQSGTFFLILGLVILALVLGEAARVQWAKRMKMLRESCHKPARKPRADIKPSACASVIIPALNEAKRIADVVAYALADPATAEVIVVDDSSIDDTAALAERAGAKVVTSSMLGKGASMKDGVGPAQFDLIVYLDGDLAGLRKGIISDLCVPLLQGDADFVKGRFGRSGGRVTELTAKPMLKIFFPELAHFAQPLGGIIAARKSLLQALSFEDGYGVDIALLIDAHLAGASIAEVDIGSLINDSQPLHDLALMVNEVSGVIFNRAKKVGRLHVEQVTAMYEMQRLAAAEFDYIVTRRKGRKRLLLLDMDGTLTTSRFVVELARITGHEEDLADLLDNPEDDAATRTDRIAALFQYTHKRKFQQAAHAIGIRPGVIEFVNRMRRRGFMVGIVSDSYFIAADIIRRRVFADFALAHTMQFENDVCMGQVKINSAFIGEDGAICKGNVVRAFRDDKIEPVIDTIWAVGDNVNDLNMLRMADRAFVIEPKSPVFKEEAGIKEIGSFAELLGIIESVNFDGKDAGPEAVIPVSKTG